MPPWTSNDCLLFTVNEVSRNVKWWMMIDDAWHWTVNNEAFVRGHSLRFTTSIHFACIPWLWFNCKLKSVILLLFLLSIALRNATGINAWYCSLFENMDFASVWRSVLFVLFHVIISSFEFPFRSSVIRLNDYMDHEAPSLTKCFPTVSSTVTVL